MSEHEKTKRNADGVGIAVWACFVVFCFCMVKGLIGLMTGEASIGFKVAAGCFALGIVLLFLRNVILIRAELEEANRIKREEAVRERHRAAEEEKMT